MALVIFMAISPFSIPFPMQLLAWLFALMLATHPLKMSMCGISYQNETLKLHYKFFQDDFQVALETYSHRQLNFSKPNKPTSNVLSTYLEANTEMVVNGVKVEFDLKNYLLDENAMVNVMMEGKIKGLKARNTFQLKNTILFDKFPEQINMYMIDLLGDKNPVSARLGKKFPMDTWVVSYK